MIFCVSVLPIGASVSAYACKILASLDLRFFLFQMTFFGHLFLPQPSLHPYHDEHPSKEPVSKRFHFKEKDLPCKEESRAHSI